MRAIEYSQNSKPNLFVIPTARALAYGEEKEKDPDKYPKVLYEGGIIPVGGQAIKGFEVVEATEEQMTNDLVYWLEIVSEEYIPIFDPVKGVPLIMAKYGLDQ
jgi:hypothetical protein